VPEVLPPPQFGTVGPAFTRRKADGDQDDQGWKVYDVSALPAEKQEIQARMAAALRELVTPSDWFAVGTEMEQMLEHIARPHGFEDLSSEFLSRLVASGGRREASGNSVSPTSSSLVSTTRICARLKRSQGE
jgi:hypothetical protein